MCEPKVRSAPGGLQRLGEGISLGGLGMPVGLLVILVVVSLTTHQVPFLLEVLAIVGLAIGVPVGLMMRSSVKRERAVRAAIAGQVIGQATVVSVEVRDSPADSDWRIAGQVSRELADGLPDRSRTGVLKAVTAAADTLADRTADNGQAVRVQVADR